MNKNIFILLMLSLSLSLFAQTSDLRGQVKTLSFDNKEYQPLKAASVILYHFDESNNSWKIVTKTITDQEGFYFFYNVDEGIYYIQVNRKKNYRISVTDSRGYQFQELPVLYY